MPDFEDHVPEHEDLSPKRSRNGPRPSGVKYVHAAVPESIFNHAKAQAYLSGLRFPEYVAKVLRDALPVNMNSTPQQNRSMASENDNTVDHS